MARSTQPDPRVDLDTLDAYLMSAEAPANSMGLSDLDGFLTGLAIGPERIAPSEWLPVIWGGDDPDFASDEEANAILGAITARYDEITAHFDTCPDDFDPVFLEGPEGDVIVTDWAAGFMDAVVLQTKSWAPLLEDEEGCRLIRPLLALGADDDEPLFGASPLSEDDMHALLEGGPDVVMPAVIAINAFWRNRRS